MTPPLQDTKTLHPTRRTGFSPKMPQKDIDQARRRHLFLKKVKDNGDHHRWEVRNDQALRRDFITRQKQWEAEQAQNAPDNRAQPDEEDPGQGIESLVVRDADVVDEVMLREEQELEALLSLRQALDYTPAQFDSATTEYGSDEEDYDRLFMEVVEEAEGQHQGSAEKKPPDLDQEMDTSIG